MGKVLLIAVMISTIAFCANQTGKVTEIRVDIYDQEICDGYDYSNYNLIRIDVDGTDNVYLSPKEKNNVLSMALTAMTTDMEVVFDTKSTSPNCKQKLKRFYIKRK